MPRLIAVGSEVDLREIGDRHATKSKPVRPRLTKSIGIRVLGEAVESERKMVNHSGADREIVRQTGHAGLVAEVTVARERAG